MQIVFAAPTSEPKLPNVKILATGGTIAGKGVSSTQMVGYTSGAIGVQDLIDAVPEIKKFANVSGEQIFTGSSSAITKEVLLKMAKRANQLLATEDVDGIVITHGTATLEETAYFLHIVIKSNKPVILVGAMRPTTALSADGSMNFLDAVSCAASKEAKGRGVLVVLNDQINSARDVTKSNTQRVETFRSPDFGQLGFLENGIPYFYRQPTRKHTLQSEFDVTKLTELPKVEIIYGYLDDDGVLVDAAVATGAKGIVHACVGHGVYSPRKKAALVEAQKKGVVVVKSSRTGSGITLRVADDDKTNFVASDTLNPQKARILLMLALTKTSDPKGIQKFFDEY